MAIIIEEPLEETAESATSYESTMSILTLMGYGGYESILAKNQMGEKPEI